MDNQNKMLILYDKVTFIIEFDNIEDNINILKINTIRHILIFHLNR